MSCTTGPPPAGDASHSPAPSAASQSELTEFYGSYAMNDGDTIVIARAGWFFDMHSGTYRTIYAAASHSSFIIGPAFQVPAPAWASLVFGQDSLTVKDTSTQRTGHRIAYKQTEVV